MNIIYHHLALSMRIFIEPALILCLIAPTFTAYLRDFPSS